MAFGTIGLNSPRGLDDATAKLVSTGRSMEVDESARDPGSATDKQAGERSRAC
jgi:hypothetical protein